MSPISNAAFLIAAFWNCPEGEVAWVAGFPGDPAVGQWAGAPILRGLPAFINAKNNNYTCVSTFRVSPDGTWHRRKANFAAMHVVMIDDIGTKVPPSRLALEPSVLVETSPDNYQAWYFLDPPETQRVRAELLIDRMIAAGLTTDAKDPGMRGVTRYGRLPVGRNWKPAYVGRLGSPFVQRVVLWEVERRYSVDSIAEAYGLDLTPEAPKIFTLRRPTKSAQDLVPPLQDLGLYVSPLDGFEDAHQIICPWLHEHTGRDETGTVYFGPSEENAWRGGFKCHHGHCMNRSISDLQHFLRAVARIKKQGT